MTLMALGPYQFQALGFSLADRGRKLDTPWAEIEVAGGEDRLQWFGGKGRSETIRGVLFSEFGGQAALDGLSRAAGTGVILPLVALGLAPNNVFGPHVFESVTEDHAFIDADGMPRRNAYTLRIRSYPGQPDYAGAAATFVQTLFA
ncbi:phage tail protein [Palleronia sp.]|uniref:phage tail protein n=1 Tax=Palleronia sp. TaxID=1940284 RepID=UPI0035C804D5